MLNRVARTAIAGGVGIALLTAAGCTVDTVVYGPPEPHRVIVEEGSPPPEAEVYVEEAPPPPEVEVIPPSPGIGFVWVGGSWIHSGRHYVWVRGRWQRPPHGRGHWVRPHWEHGPHGYVRVEGHWE
jgi:hypothetical protein